MNQYRIVGPQPMSLGWGWMRCREMWGDVGRCGEKMCSDEGPSGTDTRTHEPHSQFVNSKNRIQGGPYRGNFSFLLLALASGGGTAQTLIWMRSAVNLATRHARQGLNLPNAQIFHSRTSTTGRVGALRFMQQGNVLTYIFITFC